jgi:hypothetical protein
LHVVARANYCIQNGVGHPFLTQLEQNRGIRIEGHATAVYLMNDYLVVIASRMLCLYLFASERCGQQGYGEEQCDPGQQYLSE